MPSIDAKTHLERSPHSVAKLIVDACVLHVNNYQLVTRDDGMHCLDISRPPTETP
jgi:hypothetical protein